MPAHYKTVLTYFSQHLPEKQLFHIPSSLRALRALLPEIAPGVPACFVKVSSHANVAICISISIYHRGPVRMLSCL